MSFKLIFYSMTKLQRFRRYRILKITSVFRTQLHSQLPLWRFRKNRYDLFRFIFQFLDPLYLKLKQNEKRISGVGFQFPKIQNAKSDILVNHARLYLTKQIKISVHLIYLSRKISSTNDINERTLSRNRER